MDVLTFVIDTIRAELGEDIFSDEQRARFELAMRQQIGADRHYIASADAYALALRNAEIVRLLMSGLSTQQVAERFSLEARHIRRVRQQAIDAGVYKNGPVLP